MRILLVDDDMQRSASIVPLLEGEGHVVLRVPKLEDASKFLGNGNKLDLVIFASGQLPANLLSSSAQSQSADAQAKQPEPPPAPAVTEDQAETVPGPEAEKMRDFRNMFVALQTKYIRSLPGKLDELAARIKDVERTGDDAESLKLVRLCAHKLNGTAGSLGYRQISEPMRLIEVQLDGMIAGEIKTPEEKRRAWQEIQSQFGKALQAGDSLSKTLEDGVPEQEPSFPGPYRAPLAKVLVVDEDETFLDVVEHLGRQRMVEVVRATSVAQALEKACIVALDAALVNVPEENPEGSFGLARELRGLPGYDSLPLAFISSSSQMHDRIEALHAGASLHLDKPLQSADLESAVQHLVAIRQGGRPRVLLVDDDPDFCDLIAMALQNEGLLVRSVTDPVKVLDLMQEFPPDLMLLDVNMPKVSGFEVCRLVRGLPRWRDLPIIFLTAQTGMQARVAAFQAGADDYLPKPVINEELLARVKVRLDRSRLMKERSDKDTVTGLLLRRAFAEQLSAMLAEAERNRSIFSLCLIDVDHFKSVNDTHGHLAGDQVLGVLGQLLNRRFRVDDLRGRWGGEEFILAFRREGKERMQKAVARILEEFKQLTFRNDQGKEFHCSFSAGLASFPQDGVSIFDLVKASDQRLYHAKQTGRSRVVASDQIMS